MQAIVMEEFGAPEVLALRDFPDPRPRKGWAEVEVLASALNWHDVLVRQGSYRSELPHVIGADGFGRRRDNGERVMVVPSLFWGERESAPSPDWQILGDRLPGTYAERVLVPQECLVPAPAGWHSEASAALSLVGLTTYRALFARGRLRGCESLLVLGASGGVATTAVILASAIGAHVVVTSTDATKIAAAVELGATEGTSHDGEGWVERARELSPGGQGFDVVLDSVGRWSESIACLRPGGRCVVLGASASSTSTLQARAFYFGQYELIGTTMGSMSDMRGLLRLIETRKVRPPVIDRAFALSDAGDAHRYLETGRAFGKIILDHT